MAGGSGELAPPGFVSKEAATGLGQPACSRSLHQFPSALLLESCVRGLDQGVSLDSRTASILKPLNTYGHAPRREDEWHRSYSLRMLSPAIRRLHPPNGLNGKEGFLVAGSPRVE